MYKQLLQYIYLLQRLCEILYNYIQYLTLVHIFVIRGSQWMQLCLSDSPLLPSSTDDGINPHSWLSPHIQRTYTLRSIYLVTTDWHQVHFDVSYINGKFAKHLEGKETSLKLIQNMKLCLPVLHLNERTPCSHDRFHLQGNTTFC